MHSLSNMPNKHVSMLDFFKYLRKNNMLSVKNWEISKVNCGVFNSPKNERKISLMAYFIILNSPSLVIIV